MFSRFDKKPLASAVAKALAPAPKPPAGQGRVLTTEYTFPLTWRERVRVLVGGRLKVVSRVTLMDGEEGHATEGWKSASWPWRQPQ